MLSLTANIKALLQEQNRTEQNKKPEQILLILAAPSVNLEGVEPMVGHLARLRRNNIQTVPVPLDFIMFKVLIKWIFINPHPT